MTYRMLRTMLLLLFTFLVLISFASRLFCFLLSYLWMETCFKPVKLLMCETIGIIYRGGSIMHIKLHVKISIRILRTFVSILFKDILILLLVLIAGEI